MRTAILLTLAAACSLQAGEHEPIPDLSLSKEVSEYPKFGISGSHIYQEANYDVAQLDFTFLNPSPALATLAPLLAGDPVTGVEDSYHVTSAYLNFDPVEWLALTARLGTVEGEADAILVDPFDPVSFSYDGYVYGFGATLKWEEPRARDHSVGLFALFTAEWNQAHFGDTSENQIWVLKPKIGYHLCKQWSVYVGANRQENNQVQTGEFEFGPIGQTAFAVDLADRVHWNYTSGLVFRPNEKSQIVLEGGFGNRKHAALFAKFYF